jgi:hypothetical protein
VRARLPGLAARRDSDPDDRIGGITQGVTHMNQPNQPFFPPTGSIRVQVPPPADEAARHLIVARFAASLWGAYLSAFAHTARRVLGVEHVLDPGAPIEQIRTPSGALDLGAMTEQINNRMTVRVIAALTPGNIAVFCDRLAQAMAAEMTVHGHCDVRQTSQYDCDPFLAQALAAAGIGAELGIKRPLFEQGTSTSIVLASDAGKGDATVLAMIGGARVAYVWDITLH